MSAAKSDSDPARQVRTTIGHGPILVEACEGCGLPYRTDATGCETVCPNCGHRAYCGD